ncbi:hypothetical protein Tco_1018550 [Tanacetum coccineum]|uniref:Uncharacterized protein n=1 Tax=Tanacetum coccineum TaxID=301880 RepID=A0ABQ5FUP3_9ASTR
MSRCFKGVLRKSQGVYEVCQKIKTLVRLDLDTGFPKNEAEDVNAHVDESLHNLGILEYKPKHTITRKTRSSKDILQHDFTSPFLVSNFSIINFFEQLIHRMRSSSSILLGKEILDAEWAKLVVHLLNMLSSDGVAFLSSTSGGSSRKIQYGFIFTEFEFFPIQQILFLILETYGGGYCSKLLLEAGCSPQDLISWIKTSDEDGSSS